ncbi:MAG TPA: VCBS repeat-containing protein [Cyclobacteriaceae bacterium]
MSFWLFISCNNVDSTLFSKLESDETGITFRNLLIEDNDQFNVLQYPYFYNGGGVAIGDINNDGLEDIFFTGNMVKNRLFVNKGNLQFEDVTIKSKTAEKEGWCTGVTMIDINEDGWLDIYICRSGLSNMEYRRNLLFINNHNLTFTESAANYGLDDSGYSTQASFFDYDKDGDLDMFLINQSSPEYSRSKIEYLQYHAKRGDSSLENKLFRNDNGHFINITEQAGITSNVLSFSLGLSTADINSDGWPDIYVANDFKEGDNLYINNRNGTFSEQITSSLGHTSLYSMGLDVADYNNDLHPDIFVADMLAEDNYSQKMHMGGDNFNQYNYLFKNNMFHQYMKNSLQKNNGDGTFSEIGQLAGVAATDWSWSPLFGDFDNDGLKDLFISNGYKRDNTNIEFVIYSMNQSLRIQRGGDVINVADYISHMSSISLPNYIYKNLGQDKFENKIKDWGFESNTLSNGATYADLDNDGDLDLITNNIDEFAGVYRNNSEKLLKANFLKIKLKGDKKNPFGIGTKIFAYSRNSGFYLEQNPVRGYQSSVSTDLHLGLGKITQLDSIRVVWPDNKTQLITTINANQTISIEKKNAINDYYIKTTKPFLTEQPEVIEHVHIENQVNDFTHQFLLPHFYSQEGPCIAKADVNGDGLEDLYFGGAKGQAGTLMIQNKDHQFSIQNIFPSDNRYEDADASFFDADGDGDQDLYIVSGGYENEENSPTLQDRLYLNNGHGQYHNSPKYLPINLTNKKCIAITDIDQDGDKDLFVGGFIAPGKYPLSEPSKILIDNGKGNFSDETEVYCPSLKDIGIVKDATWIDVNNDGKEDLLVVGEWMSVRVFINQNGKLLDKSDFYFPNTTGWWNTITAHDFDHDGDLDLVIGNYGENSPLKADEKHPLKLYFQDIDNNGSVDPILTHYFGEHSYPLVGRDDLNGQVPVLKKNFPDYKSYANATIDKIMTPDQLAKSKLLSANTLLTTYFENTGKGYVKKVLPVEAQYAPVNSIIATDVNKDGNDDLILIGNNLNNRIYLGRLDANHGIVLLGDGTGNFKYLPQNKSGLNLKGDVRAGVVIDNHLIFGINNAKAKVYKY